jgi:hypothetical protein
LAKISIYSSTVKHLAGTAYIFRPYETAKDIITVSGDNGEVLAKRINDGFYIAI